MQDGASAWEFPSTSLYCLPNGEVVCFRASATGLRPPARPAASPSSAPAPLSIAHNQPLGSLPVGLGSVGATVDLNHATFVLLVAMQDAWKTWVRPLALLSILKTPLLLCMDSLDIEVCRPDISAVHCAGMLASYIMVRQN